MVIVAEGNTYTVRDGYQPTATDYRAVRGLARMQAVLTLTRETIRKAAMGGEGADVKRLTFQAERQESRIKAARQKLESVIV